MKRCINLLLVLMTAALCLCSCGKKNMRTDTSGQYIGLWECDKLIVNGEEQNDSFMGTGIPLATFYNLTLGQNGVGTLGSPMSAFTGEAEDIQQLTWESDESSVTLKGETDADILKLEYRDEHLIMSESSGEDTLVVYFERVNSFTEFDFEQWRKENSTN